jgi:hypothetical protein
MARGYGVPSAKRRTSRAASASRSAVHAESAGVPARSLMRATAASFHPLSMMNVVTMSQ